MELVNKYIKEAEIHQKNHQLDQAIESCNNALQINPNCTEAFNLMVVLEKDKKLNQHSRENEFKEKYKEFCKTTHRRIPRNIPRSHILRHFRFAEIQMPRLRSEDH